MHIHIKTQEHDQCSSTSNPEIDTKQDPKHKYKQMWPKTKLCIAKQQQKKATEGRHFERKIQASNNSTMKGKEQRKRKETYRN